MFSGSAALACDLKVTAAWIREAPPNAMTLAGYAVLSNVGNQPLQVVSVTSTAFDAVELHESISANGMTSMRPVGTLEIVAHGKIEFAPNGKHFMLMAPKQPIKKDDVIILNIKDNHACVTAARFTVSADR